MDQRVDDSGFKARAAAVLGFVTGRSSGPSVMPARARHRSIAVTGQRSGECSRGWGPLIEDPGVFQGFTGSGKSYLGCALAKQACQHRIRAHYIRMPDLEEAWALAKDKPQGQTKFLRKYSTFSLLVIDEWLLDHPDEAMRGCRSS